MQLINYNCAFSSFKNAENWWYMGLKSKAVSPLRQGKYRSPVDPRKARDKVACKNYSILKYDHQGIFLFILFADRIAFSAFLVRLFAPFKDFIELKTFLSKKTFIEAKTKLLTML